MDMASEVRERLEDSLGFVDSLGRSVSDTLERAENDGLSLDAVGVQLYIDDPIEFLNRLGQIHVLTLSMLEMISTDRGQQAVN